MRARTPAWLVAGLLCWPLFLQANDQGSSQISNEHVRCSLDGSDDQFWFYPEQLVHLSGQFAVFQNFAGRVITQVELETGDFYRTTIIGEPFRSRDLPEELKAAAGSQSIQTLTGSCQGLTAIQRWQVR